MRIDLYPGAMARVLNEAPARAALRGRANRTVADAKQTGHRNPAHKTHIIDKLAVGDDKTTDEGAVVEIDWDDWRWRFHEFGNQYHAGYRSVTRGAQNAGLRVIDRSR